MLKSKSHYETKNDQHPFVKCPFLQAKTQFLDFRSTFHPHLYWIVKMNQIIDKYKF